MDFFTLFLIFKKLLWIYNAIDKWFKDKNFMVLDEKQKKYIFLWII